LAQLVVTADAVTVTLSALEKIAALHGDLSVPRAAVVTAWTAPDGSSEIQGLRMPGTGLRGVIMAGTWRSKARVTFAVCHGRRPAVVLELAGQRYDRIVVTVDQPDQAAASLT
jgi:hypothetical protein